MNDAAYILLQGDEDGNPLRLLVGTDLDELLDDPGGTYGITRFEGAAFLVGNRDPNYWPEGVGVLIEAKVVVPRPAGKFVLP